MSHEEMQFADPEWQSPGQRSNALEQEFFHPQTVNTSREKHQTGFGSSNGKEEEPDYFTGYKAHQQRQYAFSSPKKPRKHARQWLGILFLLILLSIYVGRPFFIDGGSYIEGFILDNLVFVLVILALIFGCIAFFRRRRNL